MKTHVKKLFVLSTLMAGVGLILSSRGMAQTFVTLHNFSVYSNSTNSDGALPYDSLVLAGGRLYGTASAGGADGGGTIFSVNINGTGFTNLHDFTGGVSFNFPNGAQPEGGMVLSGSTLYGTTTGGGDSGWGVLFAMNTDGTGFTKLHSFTGGEWPVTGRMILSGSTLYGTSGGNGTSGKIFSIDISGAGYTNFYTFTAVDDFSKNSDGKSPCAELVLSGNTLYGTAGYGGSNTYGTVWAVNTNGSGFTNMHTFSLPDPSYLTNSDGARPYCGLTLSGSTLYGATGTGGTNGFGAIFAIHTDGTGFTNLHSLDYTLNEGHGQMGGLILSGNLLYGTSIDLGSAGNGAVFAVNTNGTGYTNLYSFQAVASNGSIYTNSSGRFSFAGLILSSNVLYGTARDGGLFGKGTVFSFALPASPIPPQLTLLHSGTNIILTWTNAAFGLQSAPAITGTFTNISGATSPSTNPITATQRFFRLQTN